MRKSCSKCHAGFECNSEAIHNCWCATLPALITSGEVEDCLCQNCLQELIQPKVEKIVADIKDGNRENDVRNLYVQDSKKLIEGIDFYREGSLWVLKEWFHLKRGYCCGSNCRHCPYDHVNVPGNKPF